MNRIQNRLMSRLTIRQGKEQKFEAATDIPCTEYWRDDPFSHKETSASCNSCQVRHCRSWGPLRPYAIRSRASPRISRHRSIWTANFNNNVFNMSMILEWL